MPKVLVDINQVVRVNANHGGYMAADCIACGRSGWLDGKYGYATTAKDPDGSVAANRLKHKPSCPMNKYALKAFRQE